MTLTMRIVLAFVALSGAAPTVPTVAVSQDFFVPLPEDAMFDTFKTIQRRTRAPIHSMISITVSTNQTVITYDHHEDGFDQGGNLSQSSTEIWGDRDASNGCAPFVTLCSNKTDVLLAGSSIVLENEVPIPRDDTVLYDGGDRIVSSSPIVVIRAAYPEDPGSLMAGAVEVLDTSMWGTEFTAPVGNGSLSFGGFDYVALYVMAGRDKTIVRRNNDSEFILNTGETTIFAVQQNDKITASEPVQVHLLTGDIDSAYELRWYALLATMYWSNTYLAPVGDTDGKTKIALFSPTTQEITYKIWVWVDDLHVLKAFTKTVRAGTAEFTRTIPDGTGCYLEAPNPFLALSLTDTEGSGQIFDWGYPVFPVVSLTPQVLVGLGFGCTYNRCSGNSNRERSVVWLSPTEDADCYIDFDSDNALDATFKGIKQYEHVVLNDSEDKDMSGALIFCVAAGQDFYTGQDVSFAAAWGQKGSYSYPGDGYGLDLGTVVVPIPSLNGSKFAETLPEEDSTDPDSSSPSAGMSTRGGPAPASSGAGSATAIASSIAAIAVLALLAVGVLLKRRQRQRVVVEPQMIELPKI